MAPRLELPHGYRNARYALLIVAFIGELTQGGLIFGWNALALILKAQGNYDRGCGQPISEIGAQGLAKQCASQESSLALLWNIGIFALNFGPVIIGPVLDFVGPKLTAILGTMLNITALILMGCSNTKSFNALPAGAVLLGAGGMCFHLAQLHITNLFPRNRGLVSSVFLAGFTGCAIIFYFLWLIFKGTSQTRHAYRLLMILYAMFCLLWIPLNMWMMPWHSLRIGKVYLFTDRWIFKVMTRADMEAQMKEVRMSALDSPVTSLETSDVQDQATKPLSGAKPPVDSDMALAYMGLRPQSPNGRAQASSTDPVWLDEPPPVPPAALSAPLPGTPPAQTPREARAGPGKEAGREDVDAQLPSAEISVIQEGEDKPGGQKLASNWDPPDPEQGNINQTPHNVVWGPLVFESRRFVELRQQTLWKQICSAESTGMGLFYTLNIFCIQFYLGTTRLQLEHKGDTHHTFTAMANIVPAFGFLGIPIIGWLLDKKGYGITMGTINFLGALACLFEAMPSLGFQAVTLIVWCAGRYFLYTSYFAIFGALFGFKNFGKMVAIDNTFNGLFGLLQLPLTNWALHGLNGNFTLINILQAAILMPFFIFCYMMYKWERTDLVPIRPHEGEELPCNMVGPRTLREANFLSSLEHKLPGTARGGGLTEKRSKI